MTILPAHRTFIIINQGIVSTIFNFFLNMGIAWFLYRGLQQVPLWGSMSIGLDTVMTAFILPCLSCYFIAISIWFTIRQGWIPAIVDYPTHGFIGSFIKLPVVVQGLVYGVAGVLFIGVPVVVWFMVSGNNSLSFYSFLWFKAVFAAVLSLVVSPIIGLLAFFGSLPRK